MKTIKIFWNDLTAEKQAEIQKALGMDTGDNCNWDVVPFATADFEVSDEAEEESGMVIDEVIGCIRKAEEAAWGTGDGKASYRFQSKNHVIEIKGIVIEPYYESFRPAFILKEDDVVLYWEDSRNVSSYRNEIVMRGTYNDAKALFEYLYSKYAGARFTEI